MSALNSYLRQVASKLRFWSESTYDLSTAGKLREAADEQDEKARECSGVECPQTDTRNLGRFR